MIHHSDRGVQYASHAYRDAFSGAGITTSMSRKADCYDNATMESFFHTLKTELVHHRDYKTRAEAQRDIFAFIEVFYNRTRLHSALGYIAPIEMELKVAGKPSIVRKSDAAVLSAVLVQLGGNREPRYSALIGQKNFRCRQCSLYSLFVFRKVSAKG